ncbi:hypothetical protein [Colwellia sp. E2M01]|uniref:hypothetical protein n=1 Tax=Colwellia sp. E2M01 TaxID=2841561 RepID=UPI001C093B2C|nr:hypothetical protein [Colwellia sp. E2M01]MBU2871977.1 hypothetical protein [Colwellia sp. E2M01]
MANESLGLISCSGCNGDAHIKRKKTGKKLLYLHCKNCGLDQRSGKLLQERWQQAIDGGAALPPEREKSSLINEKSNNNLNEWEPEDGNSNSDNEKSNKDDSGRSGGGFKALAGLGIAAAVILGFGAR